MKKNIRSLSFAFSLISLCCLSCTAREEPLNFLHIVADDLGVMDVGFMGDKRYHTPNIDRLASQGMIFTEGYAPAANCAPSRACVMTGQNPMFHGVYTVNSSERGRASTRKIIPTENTRYVADEHVLLTEVFKEQGYVTAQIGKWHLGEDPTTQGVDISIAGTGGGGPGRAGYFSPYENPNLPDGPKGEYLTDRLGTEAVQFLENHKDQRFFLYLPFFSVHTPIEGKPELVAKYNDRNDVDPEYAAMVESLDQNIGRVLAALDRLDLSENTVVVFTSDNGGIRKFSKQDPYRAGKGSYYEGGVRVPFTVRWPGVVEPGTEYDAPVTGLDFYPTYLDILGLKANKPLDGESLLGVLRGSSGIEKRPLFWHFPIYLEAYDPDTDDGQDPLFRTRPGSTMRYGKWKLHQYFEDMAYELYDLESDIGERNNLAASRPEKLKELVAMLDAWRAEYEAPIPSTPNPRYDSSNDSPSEAAQKPNILIIYADDLGYGDLTCYNPDSKIPTPHLDKLAKEGTRFTDGHSSSAICTPSRYALLTGRHHWRKFHGIVGVFGESVFSPKELTLPEMLQQSGYNTAAIGKWHLGWDWSSIVKEEAKNQFSPKKRRAAYSPKIFDWTKPIADGPLAHGFDYYFGDTVINFPPYAWIENDRVVDAPTIMMDTKLFKPIKEGNWEFRPGPMVEGWDPYENMPLTTKRGVEKIHELAKKEEPFFLYFAFPSPHAPIIPNDAFDGSSKAGPYGDFVVETDAASGALLAALDEAGVADNTIVIFTADNGPEHYAYQRDESFDHWSPHPLRGLKRDIYEGGHRVPYIVKWPGLTEAGAVSDALVSQIDIMTTIANALDFALSKEQAEDSYNLLPVLKDSSASTRTAHVHNTFEDAWAIRQGDWLLIQAKDGYHSKVSPKFETKHGYEADDDLPVELYKLDEDIEQRKNLAAKHPTKVKELQALLKEVKEEGYAELR